LTSRVAIPPDRTGQVWESNGYVTHLVVGPGEVDEGRMAVKHPTLVLWSHEAVSHAYPAGSSSVLWEDARRELERQPSMRGL
jgi:hypothetical protein